MPNKSSHIDPEEATKRLSEHRALDWVLMVLARPLKLTEILFWRVLGKRMRARGRMHTAVNGLPFAMKRRIDRLAKEDLGALRTANRQGSVPAICIHLHIAQSDNPKMVRRALMAISRQSFAPAHIFVTCEVGVEFGREDYPAADWISGSAVDQEDGLRVAFAKAKQMGAGWVVPTVSSAQLSRHALAAYAVHLIGDDGAQGAAVLYGDTSEVSAGLLPRPNYWLKPQWDPRMFLSQDYVSGGCILAVEPALAALEAQGKRPIKSLYQLVLGLGEACPPEHIDRVVAQFEADSWNHDDKERIEALSQKLGATARVSPGVHGSATVQWVLSDPLPKVSVVVATRDRVELLRTCVEGVLRGTNYPALDLIVADNESVEPETLSYMDALASDPRVQIVRWPHPFNYSAINNFAVAHAKGEYICLLNNDIEVLEPEWLTEMVREAVQPGVGAVGARLLYPDRSIQHAGVAIGIGNAAGHAHRGLPEGEPGYFAQALIARGASAVTAACLLVRKEHFDSVGGLDEENLAVAYNDVDLCLKLQATGLRNIYTPLATLIHHESKSRGLDFAPEHLERYMSELKVFQERWETKRAVDPWHHSFLSRSDEVFVRGSD
ncbi:MAG: glycosyltransferase family 2 protein [Pseudomonadota bacterium]